MCGACYYNTAVKNLYLNYIHKLFYKLMLGAIFVYFVFGNQIGFFLLWLSTADNRAHNIAPQKKCDNNNNNKQTKHQNPMKDGR